jgi:gluconate 2-dehydrogenase gamma chain
VNVSRTRRTFLGAAAAAAITGAAGCGGARGTNWRFFSGLEARTLDALLEWIIPEDDAPGAHAAGVIHYIDRQLTTHFREHRKTYRDGLAAADRLADGDFAGAPRQRQQAALRQLQRGPTRPFFDLLVPHALQGYYGNPRHGGNRDFVSWRMLGVSPVQVRGRAQYDLTAGGGNAKG